LRAAQLRRQASSPDFADRAAAGAQLVAYADVPALVDLLLRLLLDEEDTFVTKEVSEALLARGDLTAMRLFAKGWHRADDDQIEDFGDPMLLVAERRALWEELTMDPDYEIASGAREVLAWVDEQIT
jgi:hypothetical protein